MILGYIKQFWYCLTHFGRQPAVIRDGDKVAIVAGVRLDSGVFRVERVFYGRFP